MGERKGCNGLAHLHRVLKNLLCVGWALNHIPTSLRSNDLTTAPPGLGHCSINILFTIYKCFIKFSFSSIGQNKTTETNKVALKQ